MSFSVIAQSCVAIWWSSGPFTVTHTGEILSFKHQITFSTSELPYALSYIETIGSCRSENFIMFPVINMVQVLSLKTLKSLSLPPGEDSLAVCAGRPRAVVPSHPHKDILENIIPCTLHRAGRGLTGKRSMLTLFALM